MKGRREEAAAGRFGEAGFCCAVGETGACLQAERAVDSGGEELKMLNEGAQ
jgi:hypothetical protein